MGSPLKTQLKEILTDMKSTIILAILGSAYAVTDKQERICERRATLSAVRTCLEFCSNFSAQYPIECDLQGLGKIEKLQKLSEIPYCTTQYEKKASDCIKSFE